jgi:hypothetical protein
MSEQRQPLFLGRVSYRQRRLADAARLLPVIGGVLLMLPLIWPRDGEDVPVTSTAMIYVFGVWILLVVAAFWLARSLDPSTPDLSGEDEQPQER